jgi:hypothetical protein
MNRARLLREILTAPEASSRLSAKNPDFSLLG